MNVERLTIGEVDGLCVGSKYHEKNHRVDGLKHRELFELVFTYLYKTTITVALIYKFINKT